ncbi:hypothetical protein SAMN05519103_06212 [Rhizobiales bacterium GAS113]|nr:hypothetical protein SAMN05519103_06212 [Rhizobiales bacterium GAS113]
MAQTNQQRQDARASKEIAVRLAARRRLAVRVMTLPAVLAALAALLQAYDCLKGIGSGARSSRLGSCCGGSPLRSS